MKDGHALVMGVIFLEHLPGIVCRTVVADYEFKIVIRLVQCAFYCFAYVIFAVVCRNVNRYFGHFIGSAGLVWPIFSRTFFYKLAFSNFSAFRTVGFI